MLFTKQAQRRLAFFKMVEQERQGRTRRRSMPTHLREAQVDFSGVVLPTPPGITELELIARAARATPGAKIVKTRAPMGVDGLQF